jgi:ABC-2 type transport system ATP-binding protein
LASSASAPVPIPWLPAGRTCFSRGHLHGQPATVAKSRAGELLERFGLMEAGDRFVRTYSGGMQRRLDVALGLMHRPKVLFLDEPTTGLDPEARATIWQRSPGWPNPAR